MGKFQNLEVSKPKRHQKYPKSERNWIRNFFSIPNPILFPIPIFFPKPIPILLSIPKIFETDTIKKMEKFWNREVLKPKCHTLVKIGISSPSDCHTLTWRIHYWETQCLPLNWKVVVSKEWNLPQCLKKSSPSFQMPQLRSWIKALKYFIQFLSSHSNCALSSQAEEQCLLSAWVSKIQIAHLSHQQYFPFEEK